MNHQRTTRIFFALAVLLTVGFAVPPTADAEKATPKLQVDGDRLVVIAAKHEMTFDGIYESRDGSSIEFTDGEPVSINIGIGELRGKSSVDEVRIEEGKVVFTTDGEDILLGDGKYERQGDPEPQPEPEPEPQPRPNPNAFEVRDGEIVAVWWAEVD